MANITRIKAKDSKSSEKTSGSSSNAEISRKVSIKAKNSENKKLRSADIELRTPRKAIVSGNPSTIEIVGDKMRLYFAPEDNKTTLYIYQTQIKK